MADDLLYFVSSSRRIFRFEHVRRCCRGKFSQMQRTVGEGNVAAGDRKEEKAKVEKANDQASNRSKEKKAITLLLSLRTDADVDSQYRYKYV